MTNCQWPWGYEGVYNQSDDCISNYLKPLREKCETCEDAILAPDAKTLKDKLQAIIDRGASEGEFSASGGGASASITDSVWEYVDRAPAPPAGFGGVPSDPFGPKNPNNRYGALVPTRFLSTFTLPGFKGQLKAYQNQGDTNSDGIEEARMVWDAGATLNARLTSDMNTACPLASTYAPAKKGECVFAQLRGSKEYDEIEGSSAGIKRRIFTTGKNGFYDLKVDDLIKANAKNRVALWPPQTADLTTAVDPAAPGVGLFDVAMGLPTTATPDDFKALQKDYKACKGTPLPAACEAPSDDATMVGQARKEARQMILAFMAGARVVLAADGNPARVTGSAATNEILYTKKDWILAESTLATAAVVGPPLQSEPAKYLDEYVLYRDGPRDSSGFNPDNAGTQIKMGFGLTNPDKDGTTPPSTTGAGVADPRALKPVMTVVYVGANDGLHAFRAGPNCSPTIPVASVGCAEKGGEELWSFVPFDQLSKLSARLKNNPEGRANHTYMIARGLRFSDVFVRESIASLSIGGVTKSSLQGRLAQGAPVRQRGGWQVRDGTRYHRSGDLYRHGTLHHGSTSALEQGQSGHGRRNQGSRRRHAGPR